MTRIWALLLMGWLVNVSPAWAAETPEQLVQNNADKVLQVLRERKEEFLQDPVLGYSVVDGMLAPLIDFEAMAKLTLAIHWRRATEEQRQRYMQAFRDVMVRTYSKTLIEYSDTDLTVLPARPEDRSKSATVMSEIPIGDGKPPVSVDYKMRLVDGQWLVYDLVIEGLSVVKNFRTTYGQEIAQVGLEGLIQRLEASAEKALANSTAEEGSA